jgi:hypothetical protein
MRFTPLLYAFNKSRRGLPLVFGDCVNSLGVIGLALFDLDQGPARKVEASLLPLPRATGGALLPMA